MFPGQKGLQAADFVVLGIGGHFGGQISPIGFFSSFRENTWKEEGQFINESI
jgi:hypothetical protein